MIREKTEKKDGKDGEEEKRRFLEQKKALWWGACRYVLIRLSVSGADRDSFTCISTSLSLSVSLFAPFLKVVHSQFMPRCSAAGYNVARPHFRPVYAARG